MGLDYLSSDIIFPSDSTEPKLATTTVSKLPGPVDWAFHDYYSTACEKASLPVHTLTDYTQWKKHHDADDIDFDFKKHNRSKQEEQLRYLVTGKQQERSTSPTTKTLPVPEDETSTSNLRAALCGALEHVDIAMQDNHLTRLDKYTPGSYYQNNKEFRWEDEILFGSFKFAPEASSDPNSNNGITGGAPLNAPLHDDDEDDDDFFAPATASPISATREHNRFLDDHDDFLYERRSFTTDEEDDIGAILMDTSRITSFIASSIHQHDQLPPEPTYNLAMSSAAQEIPFSLPTQQQHQPARHIQIPPPQDEGKPAIAKSKVWQGLVGRLKKNLSKPFNKQPSQSTLLSPPESYAASKGITATTSVGSLSPNKSTSSPQPQGRLKRLLFKSRQNQN
ncbi:hypothetical protein BDC45DRAFT_571854 [Circinella umbellata]|nr:hypothetical protein BDC45DRAFT_571854 [Circinella umbellata]